MKNFIRNIKEHKFIALGCLGALILVVIITVVVSVNQGTHESPEGEVPQEQSVYFKESDYPVYITENGRNMIVKIVSLMQNDLKWNVYVDPGELPLTDNITEKDNTLYLEISPINPGYATVCFVKERDVAGVKCDDVRIELDVYAAEDDGDLKIFFSDIRQMMSSAGSLDSDTPFVLDGNRVLFPSGGDWTLSPEEGAPDNLYGFVDDVDENGIRYISVSKNISVLTDDMSGEELPRIYGLVLKSEALCVDYSINCQMGDDRSWKLSLAEENDGEEN